MTWTKEKPRGRNRVLAVLLGALTFLPLLLIAAPANAATPGLTFGIFDGYPPGVGTAAVNQPVTLRADTNISLTGTTYFIRINDADTGHRIGADCTTGTSCTRTVDSSSLATHHYVAHLDIGKGGPPPYHAVVVSQTVTLTWNAPQIHLTESAPTVPDGSSVVLTAVTQSAVTGSGLAMRITDLTTGRPVSEDCGSGSFCTASVSNADTTHQYVAWLLSGYGGPAPYPIVHSSAAYPITWTNQLWRVTVDQAAPGTPMVAHATYRGAPADVRPTQYWIYLYDLQTHQQVAACPGGSSCAQQSGGDTGDQFVGYVATINPSTTAYPPAGVIANSVPVSREKNVLH